MEKVDEVLTDLLSEDVVVVTDRGVEKHRFLYQLKEVWRGAEAIIYRGKLLGMDVVVKWRFPKPYLPREFDEMMRRRRVIDEVKASLRAYAAGIPVPLPLYADADRGVIVFQYIEGEVLRDVVEALDTPTLCRVCKELGEYLGKLHEIGIVHGDYTTGNVIVCGERVYIIDFGLATFSKRLDDHAIDVHIFFRSIESTHIGREEIMKKCFIEGYTAIRKEVAKAVLSKVNEIRKWGRYVAERKLKSVWVGS